MDDLIGCTAFRVCKKASPVTARILIIEDDTAQQARLSRYLRDQDYQVDVAKDGGTALEQIERNVYDLALVSLRTLGAGGRELIARIHDAYPDLPQIAIAGAGQTPTAAELMRAGAYSVLREPLADLVELGFTVSRGIAWKTLAREQARYRSFLRNFPGIIFWSTLDFKIKRIFGRVEEITGYPPTAFTQHELNWDDIVQFDDLADAFPAARQALAQGVPAEMEYRVQRRDGTLRWVECTLTPIPGDAGKEQDIFGVVLDLDITGRKQIEMELNQRLQEQESLFAIGRLVSSNLQIDKVMQLVVEYMAHLVDAACCTVSDWDPDNDLLTVRARFIHPDQISSNGPVKDARHVQHESRHPLVARALFDGTPFIVYVDDTRADSQARQLLESQNWYGVAGIPLVIQDRIIGLIEIYLAAHGQPFNLHDLRLLQALANQLAVAIDNARLFAAVQNSESAMRDLSFRLINVQEQERRYIARELHDELGQILTATKINIDLARRKLAQQSGFDAPQPQESRAQDEEARLRRRLDEASDLTDKALTNIRAMTVELRPTLLDDMGILPTLRWYLGRFAERTGIQVQLDVQELPARLQLEIETTIYRVVQEALTNVTRHAHASQVHVRLACAGDEVIASIEDDGRGFDVVAWSERRSEQQTLGLTGIQERAMLLNGHAVITSQPGQGTRIEMVLPAQFRPEEEA